MKDTSEELFKKYINAIFADSPLDFFAERTAAFLSTLMPVSSLFLYRATGNVTTKLAECNKTPGVHVDDRIVIPEAMMVRLRTEKHFFSNGVCKIRIFTGRETCAYADLHRSIYKVETSVIYIPLRYNLLKETSVTLLVTSAGVENYTQEHLEICTSLQPVFVDCFLSILSECSQDPREPQKQQETPPDTRPFQTFDEMTVEHIGKALARTKGKISGAAGAAALLGLNPSTLWSKIRKYRINVKGMEQAGL